MANYNRPAYNALKWGESCKNALYSRYTENAKRRGLAFELDKEMFLLLTAMDCAYCGLGPSQVITKKTAYGHYVYNGVDRIDSSEGYISGNVITCCKDCNRAKGTMSEAAFRGWVERIAKFQLMVVDPDIAESIQFQTQRIEKFVETLRERSSLKGLN